MGKYIDQKRLFQTFSELVSLDSLSFQEKPAAEYVREFLKNIGVEAEEDDAGAKLAAESSRKELVSGNIYAYIPGEIDGPPLILSAHLDTVAPGLNKKAVLGEDGIIRSDGTTVLGADDQAAVAAILEAVKTLREKKIPHRSLELVFSVAEEAYDRGIREFAFGRLRGREVYVVDMGGAIGRASIEAPTLISFQIRVKGRAAHAGSAPEQGIHSIKIAAEATAKLQLGKLDEESVRNIGIFRGGSATNVIPEETLVEGEVRSRSHEKALQLLQETEEIFTTAVQAAGATLRFDSQIRMKSYKTDPEAAVVRRFKKAAAELHIPVNLTKSFGGSDNNYYSANGISGIVISRGGEFAHSVRERIKLEDLVLAAELLILIAGDEEYK